MSAFTPHVTIPLGLSEEQREINCESSTDFCIKFYLDAIDLLTKQQKLNTSNELCIRDLT